MKDCNTLQKGYLRTHDSTPRILLRRDRCVKRFVSQRFSGMLVAGGEGKALAYQEMVGAKTAPSRQSPPQSTGDRRFLHHQGSPGEALCYSGGAS